MDRDIEQAADFAYCDDKACPVLTRHWHAPAGRGDATQPDPAMIERAVRAVIKVLYAEGWSPPNMARARDYMPDKEALKAADRAADKANDESLKRAIRAAAAVIVPATAEQIAAHIDHAREISTDDSEIAEAYRRGLGVAANIVGAYATDFAAGLSAGATGGDSGE